MIKLGIIGYGYWGPNLLRNFSSANDVQVTWLSDSRKERLALATKLYPSLNTTTNPEELIASNVDAVVIATPVYTHFKFAKEALSRGKHVLLEKPMVSSTAEANELIEIALKRKLVLMVDHTFLYTGAVQKIKSIIDTDDIGKIKYFDSTRINLGLFQPDVNVLWDLAPHDISILNYIVTEQPSSVQAVGVSHTNNGLESIAYLTVNYKSDIIAHFNCSWVSPVKIRSILIGGDKKMILFNDMEPTEKIKIYETSYTVRNDEDKQRLLIDYRTGDIFVPKLSTKEALAEMAADFAGAIIQARTPISSALTGLNVVRILEASEKSIKNRGAEIAL